MDVWFEGGLCPDIVEGARGEDEFPGGRPHNTLIHFTHDAAEQELLHVVLGKNSH